MVPGLSPRLSCRSPEPSRRGSGRCQAPRCPGRRCRWGRGRRARSRARPRARPPRQRGRRRRGAEQRRRPGGDGVSGSAGTGGRQRAGNQGGAHRVLPVSRERGGGAGGDRCWDTSGCETRGDAPRDARVPQPLAARPSAPGRAGGLRVPLAARPPLCAMAGAQRPSARLPPVGSGPVPSAASQRMPAPGTAPRRCCSEEPAALPGAGVRDGPARGAAGCRQAARLCEPRGEAAGPAVGAAWGPWRDGGCGRGAARCPRLLPGAAGQVSAAETVCRWLNIAGQRHRCPRCLQPGGPLCRDRQQHPPCWGGQERPAASFPKSPAHLDSSSMSPGPAKFSLGWGLPCPLPAAEPLLSLPDPLGSRQGSCGAWYLQAGAGVGF